MMERNELLRALRSTAADQHRCFGCGYEYKCSIRGCAINRAAAELIVQLAAENEALRHPTNPPLTLEELREMDGEPVWVVPLNDFDILPANYLVNAYEEQIVVDKFGAYLDFEDYGKTWQAYRRRPAEAVEPPAAEAEAPEFKGRLAEAEREAE